jgi:hypothetical protein
MAIFHFEIDAIESNSSARENRPNDRYFPAEHELGGNADPAEHCGGIRCWHWLAILLGSTTAVHFGLPQVRSSLWPLKSPWVHRSSLCIKDMAF